MPEELSPCLERTPSVVSIIRFYDFTDGCMCLENDEKQKYSYVITFQDVRYVLLELHLQSPFLLQ